jgi:hypothetical protein
MDHAAGWITLQNRSQSNAGFRGYFFLIMAKKAPYSQIHAEPCMRFAFEADSITRFRETAYVHDCRGLELWHVCCP